MKNLLLSGGTGFIGSKLVNHLLETFSDLSIHILVRDKKERKSQPRIHYWEWNPDNGEIASEIPKNIDTIIHLAGANIAEKRWTSKRKKVLLESRTKSSGLLVDWVISNDVPVQRFISASAIGWYGEANGARPFEEQDPAGNDFLAHVCEAWEAAAHPLMERGIRTVFIRTGLVLSPEGGMWKEMKKAFAFRVAPRFGKGKQVFSWITLHDLLRLYTFAVVTDGIHGPINAVAPHPVSQLTLVKALLKKQSNISITLPIPASLLKVGLGELSQELLKNAPVSAEKAIGYGFNFLQPNISDI